MPESKFIQFLFVFTVTHLLPTTSTTFPDDIAALKAFKAAVKPTSIPPTSCLATWNFTAADPCAVPRITHFTCGVTCSGSRVVQLTLDSPGYSGTLTPDISKLAQLITLDVSENAFYGPIPFSISSLPNLRNLILRVNSFSGSIPPSIAKLKSLQTLDFSQNSFSGSLTELNWLTGLTRLDISHNNLTGPLRKLPPNLNELALKSNSMTGPILKSVFDGLTSLMVVELSANLFTGKLKSWFFLLPTLQQADLSYNLFTSLLVGKPPKRFKSDLVAVDLSFNKIDGFLPKHFADYSALRSLALSSNRFRGPIPSQYMKNGSLRRLFLDGNYLNGSVPAIFFSVKAPFSGNLGDNCLQRCPVSSDLCLKSQKPPSVCLQAYGGKPKS